MAYLYGDRISDHESALLTERLEARGTPEAVRAAEVCRQRGGVSKATAETSLEARDTILLELEAWPDLDAQLPGLARVRDRLKAPPGQHII